MRLGGQARAITHHFTKLAEEPEKLIKQMAMELDTRLYEVGEYLEQDYYRQLDELSVNTP